MEKLTYRQAYDKIMDAYFKGEIQPLNLKFCFCGTLAQDFHWASHFMHSKCKYPYTILEYGEMEAALFSTFPEILCMGIGHTVFNTHTQIVNYEDKLFDGMCAALDVLKQIHIDRGEIIDQPIETFQKRQLITHS